MVQLVIFSAHCTAAFALVVIVALQLKSLSLKLSLAQLAKLLKLDIRYSWAALMTLVTGVMLWLIRFDAPGNLLVNPWFGAKLALFTITALLSVYPSMAFLRLKRGGLSSKMPLASGVIWAVRLEFLLLILLHWLALAPRFYPLESLQ